MGSIYDFSAKTIDGKEKSIADYKGKVLLIVNVASKCGFTPQYKGLEELYRKYKDSGLEILAFPCNQFGGQEPGTNEEIASFCSANYGVSFQIFDKIEVNGENAHPLYKFLKANAKGFINDEIKWNFTKFLVNQNGDVVDRFAPQTTPESIEKHIAELLKK
ncbi:MAG: glutathione peroxidase [Ignavibacteria bacterium]|nr:glutathione peroxidase [Ignavibacteria bacterium]